MSINSVVLSGRISSKQIEKTVDQSGQVTRLSFSLAVDRPSTGTPSKSTGEQQTADFIRIVAFQGRAQAAANLQPGQKIALTGRIQTGSYTNKEGIKVYTTDVLVNSWDFPTSHAEQELINEAKASGRLNANQKVSSQAQAQMPYQQTPMQMNQQYSPIPPHMVMQYQQASGVMPQQYNQMPIQMNRVYSQVNQADSQMMQDYPTGVKEDLPFA